MIVQRVELVDVRNYEAASFDFAPGTTAVMGANGRGKTNLVESLALLATLESFRTPSADAMVRVGADSAIVRAQVVGGDRDLLVEIELSRTGRHRVLVNRQRLPRTRDLLGMIRVTVFTPDDLVIVKGSPSERRRFLDDTLVALAIKNDHLRLELERIVRQRNTFLKQVGARQRSALDESAELTLDVWDAKLAELGDRVGHARAVLIARLAPYVNEAYSDLAGFSVAVDARYEPLWRQRGLAEALANARDDDLRRQVTTVGPHRDDVDFLIAGLPARTHASQGEQRTLALSLRLAAHRLITERTGIAPLLILDDVLSELDPGRATALLDHLPDGQVIITSASPLPPAARTDAIITIDDAMAGSP
jgi:DNA replication and repair protein RecF